MKHLVVIAYDAQQTAVDVVDLLWTLDDQGVLVVDDVAYVTKDAAGKVHLHLTRSSRLAGAITIGAAGLMAGLLFAVPIAGAVVGAGLGAVAGSLGDLGDRGIDDAFVQDVGAQLQANGSAVVVLAEHAVADKVVPEVARYGGTVMRTTLSPAAEERLQSALRQGPSSTDDAS